MEFDLVGIDDQNNISPSKSKGYYAWWLPNIHFFQSRIFGLFNQRTRRRWEGKWLFWHLWSCWSCPWYWNENGGRGSWWRQQNGWCQNKGGHVYFGQMCRGKQKTWKFGPTVSNTQAATNQNNEETSASTFYKASNYSPSCMAAL